MDNILLIVGIYWISVIGITYYVRHKNSKANINPFAEKETVTKKIATFLAVALLIPFCAPFILIYLVYNWLNKRYYRNRPRPVPKDKRKWLRKDTVFDESNSSISLSTITSMEQSSL